MIDDEIDTHNPVEQSSISSGIHIYEATVIGGHCNQLRETIEHEIEFDPHRYDPYCAVSVPEYACDDDERRSDAHHVSEALVA